MGPDFLKDFTTRYMDPTEVYARIEALADEFPNIARLVPLPYKTNGYQRRAQARWRGAKSARQLGPRRPRGHGGRAHIAALGP